MEPMRLKIKIRAEDPKVLFYLMLGLLVLFTVMKT